MCKAAIAREDMNIFLVWIVHLRPQRVIPSILENNALLKLQFITCPFYNRAVLS